MTTTTDTAAALHAAHLRSLPTELARARYRHNLTVREVAAAVSIGYGMLSNYERGKWVPRAEARERLAAFYGVEVAELFPGRKVA